MKAVETYWDSPEREHHRPKPLYGGRFGRSLVGYVCDCCDRIFSPNMRPTGAYLSNQPPVSESKGIYIPTVVHEAPHRAPHFHHNARGWGRLNRRHAARVEARTA